MFKLGAKAPCFFLLSNVESLVNAPWILFWLQDEETDEAKFVAKRLLRIEIAYHQLFGHRFTLLDSKVEAIVAHNVEVHALLPDVTQLAKRIFLLG